MEVKPLTHYLQTLEWFEQKAQKRMLVAATSRSVSLNQAREEIAIHYQLSDWQSLVRFCRGAGVFKDRNTIQYRRKVDASVSDAWRCLIDPEHLGKWHIPTEMELRVGGKFEFKDAWKGTIRRLEDGHLIEFAAEKGGYTVFSAYSEFDSTFILIEDFMAPNLLVDADLITDGKSKNENQPGGAGTHWHGVTSGWHYAANSLANLLQEKQHLLNYEVLDQLYAELLAAYHGSKAA